MRPIKVTVGPLGTANASNIGASQTPNAGTGIVLNGALATSLTSGTGSISGNTLTLTAGQFPIGATVNGSQVVPCVITDIFSLTLGTYRISVAQTVSSTTLYANVVATTDTPREILITTTGNESSNTFTVIGTDWANNPATEVITGANIGTTASVLSYKTVTSIVAKNTAAAALTVGTNTVASSPWVRLDPWANPNVQVSCVATGTVNYTVQQTADDPNSPTDSVLPQSVTWQSATDPNLQGATGNVQSSFAFAPAWVRVLLNSGSGSVAMNLTQYDVVNR